MYGIFRGGNGVGGKGNFRERGIVVVDREGGCGRAGNGIAGVETELERDRLRALAHGVVHWGYKKIEGGGAGGDRDRIVGRAGGERGRERVVGRERGGAGRRHEGDDERLHIGASAREREFTGDGAGLGGARRGSDERHGGDQIGGEVGTGKIRADEDAIVKEIVERVAEEERRDGVGAGGKIRDGIVTVAIGDDAVARAGGEADAGEALAGEGNATGDRVAGVAVADGDEEQTRSDGALHIGDGAGDDILAGSSEAAGERGGVGAHDGSGGGGVVGRAPVVGERICVGIGGGGGEGDLRAGGDVERARREREGGRAIG